MNTFETDDFKLDAIVKAEQSVYEFNRRCGRFKSPATKQQLLEQLALIQEELNETIAAVEENDELETVDGAADVFVTVQGFLQMLEAQGHAVYGAIMEVTDNNLTKFVPEDDVFTLHRSIEHYDAIGMMVAADYDARSKTFGLKTLKTGKLVKPIGYKKPILDSFVSKEV